jgi:truncated hemoglobin YjbI
MTILPSSDEADKVACEHILYLVDRGYTPIQALESVGCIWTAKFKPTWKAVQYKFATIWRSLDTSNEAQLHDDTNPIYTPSCSPVKATGSVAQKH